MQHLLLHRKMYTSLFFRTPLVSQSIVNCILQHLPRRCLSFLSDERGSCWLSWVWFGFLFPLMHSLHKLCHCYSYDLVIVTILLSTLRLIPLLLCQHVLCSKQKGRVFKLWLKVLSYLRLNMTTWVSKHQHQLQPGRRPHNAPIDACLARCWCWEHEQYSFYSTMGELDNKKF